MTLAFSSAVVACPRGRVAPHHRHVQHPAGTAPQSIRRSRSRGASLTDRAAPWCLIVATSLILCSCRGLDPTTWGSHPEDRVAQRTTTSTAGSSDPSMPMPDVTRPPVTPAQSGGQQLARLPSVPAQQSLTDTADTADGPAASLASDVIPVGHTTPVAPAAAAVGPFPRGVWCPPGYPPPVPGAPCPPAGTPCPSCLPQQLPNSSNTGCPNGLPCGAWTPPGLTCPWPDDEYLCDGGDEAPAVRIRNDWRVDGLQTEDTVVHYDTVTGDTHVQPSNRVCIYAPRFAAVRKVYGIVQHDARQQPLGVENPVPLEGVGDVRITTTAVQPVQPGLNLGTRSPSAFRDRMPPTGFENSQGLTGIHGGLLPYERFAMIHRSQMDNSEKARLAERVAAAAAWSHDTALQVAIDNLALQEDLGVAEAESLHIFSLEGKPRLQVCKIASRHEARPGETVEFTIRFDNVGDQVIGNVTVIDNLTTRLEYVEGSQSCTLKANFSVSDNQSESLTLRWEIVEPMPVGEGGIIRFQCRVR
ncbi:MAG: DUF11 domain-containing protein [Planctomycetaceae bacterium]|nr:DUF11 domain-containing protein [Planctomycetaceae bacterium]